MWREVDVAYPVYENVAFINCIVASPLTSLNYGNNDKTLGRGANDGIKFRWSVRSITLSRNVSSKPGEIEFLARVNGCSMFIS